MQRLKIQFELDLNIIENSEIRLELELIWNERNELIQALVSTSRGKSS